MQHGTASTYCNHRCRCGRCCRAWQEYSRTPERRANQSRIRAKRLSLGLTQNSRPRRTFYSPPDMELMAEYGFTPHPRFLP